MILVLILRWKEADVCIGLEHSKVLSNGVDSCYMVDLVPQKCSARFNRIVPVSVDLLMKSHLTV